MSAYWLGTLRHCTRWRNDRSGNKYLLLENVVGSIVHVLRQPRRVWIQELRLWPF